MTSEDAKALIDQISRMILEERSAAAADAGFKAGAIAIAAGRTAEEASAIREVVVAYTLERWRE